MVSLDSVRIGAAGDVRACAEAFRMAVSTILDWRIAVCHNIASKQMMRDADGEILATAVFGWTEGDTDRWWRSPNLALDSPLPMACRYESEPFWCNSLGFHGFRKNEWLDAIDLSNFERRALAWAAIVIPVHLPFGQIGAVSFTPRNADQTDLSREFADHADMLGLYSRAFVTSYHRVMVERERLPTGHLLSKREVECLRWAAIGKTDEEIGLIISRTRATVRFHIHNAAVKLDSVNRSQTVYKAAQLGYIAMVA